jgi:hemerythrin superfamily protein
MNIGADIYALLKDEHQSISSLLQQLIQMATTDTTECNARFAELKHSLTRHSEAEDAIFYSELMQHDQTRDLIQNGKQEHQRIESLLQELGRMDPNDPQWCAKLQTLKTCVEHHVHEEEGQVFARARTILPADLAEDLGRKFEQAKAGQAASQVQATAESYAPQAIANMREAGEHVRREAQHLTEEVTAKGRSLLHDQQHVLADQIGSVAEALHHTAQQLGDPDQRALAQYTHQAAEGLERFSHRLREQDLSSVVGEVEDFARRQPMAFIGGAAVLGFLVSRFLKSSAESRHASDRPTQAGQPLDGSNTIAAPGFSAEDAAVGGPSIGQPTTTSTYRGQ